MSTARHSRNVEAEGMDDAWRVDNSSRTEQAIETDRQRGWTKERGSEGVHRNERQEGRGEKNNGICSVDQQEHRQWDGQWDGQEWYAIGVDNKNG